MVINSSFAFFTIYCGSSVERKFCCRVFIYHSLRIMAFQLKYFPFEVLYRADSEEKTSLSPAVFSGREWATFPVIIVETLANFFFPPRSMLISKTFMPKQTRVKPTLSCGKGRKAVRAVHEMTKFMSCMFSGSVPTNYYRAGIVGPWKFNSRMLRLHLAHWTRDLE